MEFKFKKEFDEWLDESNPGITIGGLEYIPSRVLYEIDPIAYNELYFDFLSDVGLNDDGEDDAI